MINTRLYAVCNKPIAIKRMDNRPDIDSLVKTADNLSLKGKETGQLTLVRPREQVIDHPVTVVVLQNVFRENRIINHGLTMA